MFHVFEYFVFYRCCKYEKFAPLPRVWEGRIILQGELGAYMVETVRRVTPHFASLGASLIGCNRKEEGI